jgi:hypothetical protein
MAMAVAERFALKQQRAPVRSREVRALGADRSATVEEVRLVYEDRLVARHRRCWDRERAFFDFASKFGLPDMVVNRHLSKLRAEVL